MISVFVIDGTEQQLYVNSIRNGNQNVFIDSDASLDRGLVRLDKKPYDLLVISKAAGRSDLYDVANVIQQSVLNRRSEIILIEDHPSVSARFKGLMRGRKVYCYKSNQLSRIEDLVGRMEK